MGIRATINEVKTIKANIATLAKSEGKTARETASMLQAGAALTGNDRVVALVAIAKKGM